MQTANECRMLDLQYRDQANMQGVSPRMSTILKSMSKSFSALANQYEILFAIAAAERRQK